MRRALVTGGAGFIGTNLADRLLGEGQGVRILDSLARPGVERNLEWLRGRHGRRLEVAVADLRDPAVAAGAVRGVDSVFHLAAQVAVTTSLEDPAQDFDVNLQGTVNLLEAARAQRRPPAVVFTSTNKVYGGLQDVELRDSGRRYEPVAGAIRRSGISEDRPLDFCTPYGCSKGAADQYVLDYARSFGLETVVFRMSCIYGPHQCGNEDQGWVAHFAIRALEGEPITLYGDGAQVRDILFVDDLVDAMLLAREHIANTAGLPFNMGGGAENAVSLLEVLDLLAELNGDPVDTRFDGERAGDQRYYVADSGRFRAATGWRPTIGAREGVERLVAWLAEERADERALRAVAG